MTELLVAVVGSADAARTDYEPPLRNIESVVRAAERLGHELAVSGCQLSVYSSTPGFVEADVVRGYVASGKAKPASIRMHFPQVVGSWERPQFPEETTHPELFDVRTGSHRYWEVAFYESLRDVNGLLLIGGARATVATGMIARAFDLPLVALGTFGGAAQTVCSLGAGMRATPEERTLMARDRWSDDAAAPLVRSLIDQRRRREAVAEDRRRAERLRRDSARNRAVGAAAATIGAVLLTLLGIFAPNLDRIAFGVLFFGTPMLAGAAGGLARTFMAADAAGVDDLTRAPVVAVVLGMIAGLIAGVLFLLAQMASNPEILALEKGVPTGLRLLIIFGLVIGFIGGFTLEAVFGKLQRADVVNVDAIGVPGAGGRT